MEPPLCTISNFLFFRLLSCCYWGVRTFIQKVSKVLVDIYESMVFPFVLLPYMVRIQAI